MLKRKYIIIWINYFHRKEEKMRGIVNTDKAPAAIGPSKTT